MGYIPRQDYENKHFKLFGHNNYFLDNSKWVKLDFETKFKEDLQFSFANNFLLICDIFNHFKIEINENDLTNLINDPIGHDVN